MAHLGGTGTASYTLTYTVPPPITASKPSITWGARPIVYGTALGSAS